MWEDGHAGIWRTGALLKKRGDALPLTSDKTTLKAAIDALIGQGGTAGHLGTSWAYYMLSPNWSSLLTGEATPAAYGAAKTKKIAILMTDGEYNHTYEKLKTSSKDGTVYAPVSAVSTSSAGASGETSKSINGNSSAYQAMQICAKMKSNGIEVYTVGFELGGNQTAIGTLNNCATDPTHAYTADNVQELQDAFKDIAVKTVKLHLSQ